MMMVHAPNVEWAQQKCTLFVPFSYFVGKNVLLPCHYLCSSFALALLHAIGISSWLFFAEIIVATYSRTGGIAADSCSGDSGGPSTCFKKNPMGGKPEADSFISLVNTIKETFSSHVLYPHPTSTWGTGLACRCAYILFAVFASTDDKPSAMTRFFWMSIPVAEYKCITNRMSRPSRSSLSLNELSI